MSDDLTPGEHADLRARLLTGTKRIKPVGRRRTAWLASTIAVALVAGLAGGAYGVSTILGSAYRGPISTPAPTSDHTAPASPTEPVTPGPTRTSEPIVQPVVAFDGDCSRVLSPDEVEGVLEAPADLWDPDAHFATSTGRSAALLGGVMCSWHGENFRYVSVSVLDAAAVPEDIKDEYSSLQCSGMSALCEVGVVVGDVWIGAGLTQWADPWVDMTAEQRAAHEARVRSVIDLVTQKIAPAMAVATPRDPQWWSLGTCADLTTAVQRTVGEPLTVGFPGDSIPHGMDWEILVRSGMDDWCSWYSSNGNSSTIVELYPQPGAGAPSDVALDKPNVRATSVAGADAAWIEVDPQHPGTAYAVATAGPNRLTIVFADDDPAAATEVLAAVLAELG